MHRAECVWKIFLPVIPSGKMHTEMVYPSTVHDVGAADGRHCGVVIVFSVNYKRVHVDILAHE